MRGLGRVFRQRLRRADGTVYENPVWWISYSHRGKEYRESSDKPEMRLHGSEADARRLLRRRLGEIHASRFIGPAEDRLTFEDMVKDLENDYEVNDKRSLDSVKFYLKHLRQHFGMDRAVDITPDRVRAYQSARLKKGASSATVNREVAILGRTLSLAVDAGKLSRKPKFKMLEENNVRQGFLDHGNFVALRDNLADHLKDPVTFLYLSGWRVGEMRTLEWRDVDLSGHVVRLRPEVSKNRDGRVLPLAGELLEVVERAREARRLDCVRVFHDKGRPIGDFRKAWETACVATGLGQFVDEGRGERKKKGRKKYRGLIVHDLRRTAARNLSRAGVPETVAMEITGHKTRSMYRRYRIVDERDLREATERLQAHLKGQDGAKVATTAGVKK